jgi:hypothetical protein
MGSGILTALRDGRAVALFTVLVASSGCMWGTSGNNQVGLAGTTLPTPLTVTLWDNNNNPLPNVTVTFAVTGGGGSVTAGSGMTNGAGQVQTSLHLGPGQGLNTVVATAIFPGVTIKNNPFTFNAWGADSGSWTIYNDQNATRASVGLPPLQMSLGLCQMAQTWSNQMAAQGFISHNPNLGPDVGAVIPNWSAAGENVGSAGIGAIDPLYAAFVASPHHYANIVGDYKYVGVGSATSGTAYFVTIDFAKAP